MPQAFALGKCTYIGEVGIESETDSVQAGAIPQRGYVPDLCSNNVQSLQIAAQAERTYG
jgi:hypothetical protein